MPKFWNITKNENEEAEIRINGDIGESFWSWLFDEEVTTWKAFKKDLDKLKGQPLTVWINSDGGSTSLASQIYTALKEYKGKITVKIDGNAISAASVIAMAADEIHMSPTSIMMIHNPSTGIYGEKKDFEKIIEILDEVKESIINAYEIKTGLNRDKISMHMNEELWMSAKKAKDFGFSDKIMYNDDDETKDEEINNKINKYKLNFSNRFKPLSLEDLKDLKKEKDGEKDEGKNKSNKELMDLYKLKIQQNEKRKVIV